MNCQFYLGDEFVFRGRDIREILALGHYSLEDQRILRLQIELVGDSPFWRPLLDNIECVLKRFEDRKEEQEDAYRGYLELDAEEWAEMEVYHIRHDVLDYLALDKHIKRLAERLNATGAKYGPTRVKLTSSIAKGASVA